MDHSGSRGSRGPRGEADGRRRVCREVAGRVPQHDGRARRQSVSGDARCWWCRLGRRDWRRGWQGINAHEVTNPVGRDDAVSEERKFGEELDGRHDAWVANVMADPVVLEDSVSCSKEVARPVNVAAVGQRHCEPARYSIDPQRGRVGAPRLSPPVLQATRVPVRTTGEVEHPGVQPAVIEPFDAGDNGGILGTEGPRRAEAKECSADHPPQKPFERHGLQPGFELVATFRAVGVIVRPPYRVAS